MRGGGANPGGSEGCDGSGVKLDELDRGINPEEVVGIL